MRSAPTSATPFDVVPSLAGESAKPLRRNASEVEAIFKGAWRGSRDGCLSENRDRRMRVGDDARIIPYPLRDRPDMRVMLLANPGARSTPRPAPGSDVAQTAYML